MSSWSQYLHKIIVIENSMKACGTGACAVVEYKLYKEMRG